MRYAVISDIHSNLEALEAVLAEIDALGADKTVCLGDIVGYNANPNECIEKLKDRGISSVMGNHDSRATGHTYPGEFNPMAAEAVMWTRGELTEENREFLRELPASLNVDGKFLAVHGWVNDTDSYIYSTYDALENFKLLKLMTGKETDALCLFGHTHVSVGYSDEQGRVEPNTDNPLGLLPGRNYLVNPGSVGQPRDNDPRAAFLILDVEGAAITFHRVEYDMESAGRKVLDAGLPDLLSKRLKTGW
jgi:diadenosine tetraphosphatase ApaH/serine/threonine PP2A family protein phosphatase